MHKNINCKPPDMNESLHNKGTLKSQFIYFKKRRKKCNGKM